MKLSQERLDVFLSLLKPVLGWFQQLPGAQEVSHAEVEVCWTVAWTEGSVDGPCLGLLLAGASSMGVLVCFV